LHDRRITLHGHPITSRDGIYPADMLVGWVRAW
jgi:hypothetical protein